MLSGKGGSSLDLSKTFSGFSGVVKVSDVYSSEFLSDL